MAYKPIKIRVPVASFGGLIDVTLQQHSDRSVVLFSAEDDEGNQVDIYRVDEADGGLRFSSSSSLDEMPVELLIPILELAGYQVTPVALVDSDEAIVKQAELMRARVIPSKKHAKALTEGLRGKLKEDSR